MFIERTDNRNIPLAGHRRGIAATTSDSDETVFWLAVLATCNISLVFGHPSLPLVFFPDAISSGGWWRLLTFPFVHVSWYHLLLDGVAFLMLWQGLEERSLRFRAVYLTGCWAGSLLLSLIASDLVATHGLCGLSGISHGLMGITALEMMALPLCERGKIIGATLFAGLAAKCLWEMITGKVLLASFHLGSVGTPVVETHAGGLIGGVAAFTLLALVKRLARKRDTQINEDKE